MKCRLIAILVFFAIFITVADLQAAGLSAVHNLNIELIPSEKKLIGRDEITIRGADTKVLAFRISQNLSQIKVKVGNEQRDFEFQKGHLLVNLKPFERNAELRIDIQYTGIFDDPVPVRPVNTDNPGYGVTGTISSKGTFLLAGAGWYPELINSRATHPKYRLSVKAPAGLIAVTAGRSLGHSTYNASTISTWEIDYPVRGRQR